MANRWLHTNKIKTVQTLLTADQSASGYPASNLQGDNYARTWRTTDVASAHTVVQDFGAATQCDTVFLGNVNFTSAATVKIQANATDAWGSPSFEETLTVSGLGNNPAHRNLYRELASAQTFRYFRISINDAGNTFGFYEVGEWWLGSRVELTQDFQSQHRQTFIRNNVMLRTEWAQKYAYERANARVFNLEWTASPSTLRDQFRVLENTVKANAFPFVWIPEATTLPAEAFFVRMSGDLEIIQVNPTGRAAYQIAAVFEEEAAGVTVPQ